jgi:hypothetical protein
VRDSTLVVVHNETLSVVAMRISNRVGCAKHRSRSHHAMIRVYDEADR